MSSPFLLRALVLVVFRAGAGEGISARRCQSGFSRGHDTFRGIASVVLKAKANQLVIGRDTYLESRDRKFTQTAVVTPVNTGTAATAGYDGWSHQQKRGKD